MQKTLEGGKTPSEKKKNPQGGEIERERDRERERLLVHSLLELLFIQELKDEEDELSTKGRHSLIRSDAEEEEEEEDMERERERAAQEPKNT